MKVVLCIVALLALVAADDSFARFNEFMRAHGKTYNSFEEFSVRFTNFKNSIARIDRKNREHGTPVFGVNRFSDLSPEEFKANYLNYKPSAVRPDFQFANASGVYSGGNVDWRQKGAVSDVKDQGQCGSCWAFSVTEELESMWFLKTGTLPTLAPQQVVSCDKTDDGCNGGDPKNAYQYIESAGGIVPESDFPYKAEDSSSGAPCKFDKTKVVAPMTGFKYATPPCTSGSCNKQDESTLLNSLSSVGPLSICVYAESWQDYTSGVLKKDCPKAIDDLDHCVQLVGFQASSADSSTGAWIIRNSWASSWGESGYIRVQYGSNLCGVADEATYVTF